METKLNQPTTWKLTDAEADILRAYRDNGFHNRSALVTGKLITRGLLQWQGPAIGGELTITQSGINALKTHDTGAW